LGFDGGFASGTLGGGQAIDAGGVESGVDGGMDGADGHAVEDVVSLGGVASGDEVDVALSPVGGWSVFF
jgi:hypothetical protein